MPLANEINIYESLTPKSRVWWEEARKYMPGGDTRTSVFWPPYPLFFDHGAGSRIWDVDGVERHGWDRDVNPYPYALADFYNHAMRYPAAEAFHAARVSTGAGSVSR